MPQIGVPESQQKYENDILHHPDDKVEQPPRSEPAYQKQEVINFSEYNQPKKSEAGLDESMYNCYNQYISVEVSAPMWSNEGV